MDVCLSLSIQPVPEQIHRNLLFLVFLVECFCIDWLDTSWNPKLLLNSCRLWSSYPGSAAIKCAFLVVSTGRLDANVPYAWLSWMLAAVTSADSGTAMGPVLHTMCNVPKHPTFGMAEAPSGIRIDTWTWHYTFFHWGLVPDTAFVGFDRCTVYRNNMQFDHAFWNKQASHSCYPFLDVDRDNLQPPIKGTPTWQRQNG